MSQRARQGFDDHGHAEAALKGRALLAAERRVAAVRPGEGFGTVVAGKDHDGVVGDAEIVDLLEDGADFDRRSARVTIARENLVREFALPNYGMS
jgi:hypothetical protein